MSENDENTYSLDMILIMNVIDAEDANFSPSVLLGSIRRNERETTYMSTSPLATSESVSMLLVSLQRLCRNLTHLLNALDADVDLFERLLTQVASSMQKSSSSNTDDDIEEDIEKNEDFYEQLCDEQLEPRSVRVTAL